MRVKALVFTAMLALGACHSQMKTQGQTETPALAVSKIPGNPDMSPLVAEVDTNHDGKMSRAEWQAAGLPISSFNMFENGRGYVTQADYDSHAAPKDIDINGDGKLTVAEFKAFDKMGQAKRGPNAGDGARRRRPQMSQALR